MRAPNFTAEAGFMTVMASPALFPQTEPERLKKRLERERKARLDAERIAELGMRQLFMKQKELELLREVATAANEAESVEQALRMAIERICSYTNWPVGHAYVLDVPNGELVSSVWHLKSPEQFESFRQVSDRIRFPRGIGLPGRVLDSGRPAWIQDVTQDDNFPRANLAKDIGVRAGFGFPVLVGKEVMAVLEFFSDTPSEPDALLMEAMGHIGTQLGRVIERKRYEKQLFHNAFHDSLTDLPNRALLFDRLNQALARAKRYAVQNKDYLFAVIFIDLDRFKVVNDSLGHLVGDQLLVEMSRRIQRCLRTSDTVARLGEDQSEIHTVARFGGDEYAILLDDIKHVSDATRVVERLRKELQMPFNLDGREVFASASIGIALSTTGYEHPEELLRDADIAMYRAKALGSGRHQVFDISMHERIVKLLDTENDLRRAVERHEFQLHYQPIVSLQSGRVAGFEALVRWQHPDRGLIYPGEFIPVAEETELIIPISEWILREACQQAHEWQAQFSGLSPWSVSVNLTSRYFARKNLLQEIGSLITENKLDPCHLRLEITESQIMQNAKTISETLLHLDNSGIGIYIDDFGTGYSSLSYLSSFRVHSLKIDQSFVGALNADEKSAAIVRSIISLGHSLGLKVIAEGVETAEQLNYLRALQCDYGQGYYFSRPVDTATIADLILQKPQW
ncbi:MAG: EAL domain-containing protein [Acidobacteria bacterium]|nr:EAL domain-containing protein [Acidobacteriota bacterium]